MAVFKDFEEIIAWQKAIDLSVIIHTKFRDHKDFAFRDRIHRASISVSNNIAEGFDRGSNKDFRRFLRIARSSCNEVRSMVILGQRFGYFTPQEVIEIRGHCIHLNATIFNLMKAMREDHLKSIAPWLIPLGYWVGYL
ncbi:MAG: four helix bundle protein [Flavobacteriales bacterium]|nr:four helix bundle protein [Flavobacteriales bacterium]